MDKKSLTLRAMTVVPLWSDEEHILVRDLPEGMLLSTTPLVFAPDGAKVEIMPDAEGTTK